jgi:hypothetical protein
MTINFKLVVFILTAVSVNIYSQIYESIEKNAAEYFVSLSNKDSKVNDNLFKLNEILLKNFQKGELENKYQISMNDFEGLRNHFNEYLSSLSNISSDSALFLFHQWYLRLNNTFYDYIVNKFFSSSKIKILFLSTSMSCYCTLEMCKNQLIDIIKLVTSSNGEYDYISIDAYEKDDLPLKYETLFTPSVLVFDGNNEVIHKIEYDEKMINNLINYLNKQLMKKL